MVNVVADRPLSGCTILVTRSGAQAGSLSEKLSRKGARVIEAPVIDFEEPADWAPADGAITRIGSYDCAVFTSANAVERFCARLALKRGDLGPMKRIPLVAVGPATAKALEDRGLRVASIPAKRQAEGVLDLFEGQAIRGKRILMPRAMVAREKVPDRLRELGAIVDVAPVYRTVQVPLKEEVREMLRRGEVNLVTFTSSSSVDGLVAGMGGVAPLRNTTIAVIGPITAETVRGHGLTPAIVAKSPSMDDLVEAISDGSRGPTSWRRAPRGCREG